MKNKYIYKTAVVLLVLGLLFVCGSTFMLSKTLALLAHWELLIYSGCLMILAGSVFILFFRKQSSESLRLDYREQKIEEEQEKLQQQQQEYESNLTLLIQKENEVKAFDLLNTALFLDGLFVYVPKNVKIEQPIQLINRMLLFVQWI